jgi:hypothetical protein
MLKNCEDAQMAESTPHLKLSRSRSFQRFFLARKLALAYLQSNNPEIVEKIWEEVYKQFPRERKRPRLDKKMRLPKALREEL